MTLPNFGKSRESDKKGLFKGQNLYLAAALFKL